jgi:hypothetical protein
LLRQGAPGPLLLQQAPPPRVQGYQGARRSHPLLRMSSCILFDGTGNPKEASNTRPWEKADLNGLQFRSPIFIINLIISTPIHPLSVFNDSTRVNCAQAPMHAATPRTTPITSCSKRKARQARACWQDEISSPMKSLQSSGMRSSCKTGVWSKSLQSSSILITWTTQLEGSSIPSFIQWRGIHTLQWLYRISTGN